MALETKIKQAALMTAVDISLKRMQKSPERCARNLTELGFMTFPNKISKDTRDDFFEKLLLLCKAGDSQGARELFTNTFFQEQDT